VNTPEKKLNNDKSWCDENSRYSTHDNINELIERGRGGETTRRNFANFVVHYTYIGS